MSDHDPESYLRTLLARIHRDGGHYTGEHGLEKSVADADRRVADLNAMSDDLAEVSLAAQNYVRCVHACLSPYIKENGRHGGSPWSELVDAVAVLTPTEQP